MQLTEIEQDMLDGRRGEGVRMAMEIVVMFGELYGANRLLPVKNAHIDAAAYTTIYDAGTDFVEYLANNGARVAQPTTINPTSRDIDKWREMGLSPEFAAKCERLEKAYLAMGVSPTWACTPYQCTSVPSFGEIVSWSESNAVNFANSVLGARANRLPDLVDVCCAVTGRVPEYGLYITENRAGELLFELEGFEAEPDWFQDQADYSALGYLVGEISVQRVPVILGLPQSSTPDQFKALSAAAASGGSTALFHAVGITPEAPTLEEAFQGRTGYERVKITPDSLRRIREKLSTASPGAVDMVMLGCPFLSFAEVREVRDYFGGRRVAAGTRFWLCTSRTVYDLCARAGLAGELEEQGVTFIRDTCLMASDTGKDWGFKTVLTNSGKIAQYVPALAGASVALLSTPACVEAAVKGRW